MTHKLATWFDQFGTSGCVGCGLALNNATRPFIMALADKGFPRALIDDAHLRNGLSVHRGKIACRAVADALRLPRPRLLRGRGVGDLQRCRT